MKNCIFCQISNQKIKSWKVYENEYVYSFLDINPVNKYHTLVIPKKHYQDIFDIPENELKQIIIAVKKIAVLYRHKLGIKHVQIINSSGSEAQQDIFHIHFHIVPRTRGDGQDIKWIPRLKLRKQFDKLIEKLK